MSEIVLCLLLGDSIPYALKSFSYALSLTIKGVLLTILPFIIFSFLISSMRQLKTGALSFVILAFILICSSNFISTTSAGFLGILTLDAFGAISPFAAPTQVLHPLWSLNFTTLISNELALFLGLVAGIIVSFLGNQRLNTYADKLQTIALLFLKRVFIPLIPIFILGFIFKIQHEDVLEIIVKDYLSVFLLTITATFGYIMFLYGLSTQFRPSKWLVAIKNMIPAAITGFSTMSSASALPLIVEGAEKNTKDPLTKGIVPFSVNIHLIGDCFFISLLALGILLSFGHELPSFSEYLIFTVFFVLAKFAVAAVPGGGVLVMLPVLEKYLGFSGEMLSLMTAIYILFDPIITCANVMGNGSFAMIFSKIYKALILKQKPIAEL